MGITYYKQTYETTPRQSNQTAERNFVICIDGTGNDRIVEDTSKEATSNVYRLFQSLKMNNEQIGRYYPGVGSQENDDNSIRKAFGGVTGAGARRIRLTAYLDFIQNYQIGDRLYIFGFSRGAAIARTLANHIAENGVPENVTAKFIRQLFRDDLLEEVKCKGKKHEVKIEMLGVWDTVAAFGNPLTHINLFKNLTVAPNVESAYHLVSIDEDRQPFQVSLMNYEKRINEIWFPGVHSDVGGSYPDHQLADVSLQFMMNRASELGVNFKDQIDDFNPNMEGTIHNHNKSPFIKEKRIIEVKGVKGKKPLIHTSAFKRKIQLGHDHPTEYLPDPLRKIGNNYKVDDRE